MSKIWVFFNLLLIIVSFVSCDDDFLALDLPKVVKKPVIETTPVSSISSLSANGGGNITFDGGGNIISKGICFATKPNPSISDIVVNSNSFDSYFSAILQSLTPNTTYYVKAFATNSAGISYGNEISFKTLGDKPTITTASASNITTSSFSSGGNVLSDGGVAVTSRGICFSTTPNPSIFNSIINVGSGLGVFIANASGLQPSTTYYLRAYATNSIGTSYGNQISFTTNAVLPTLTTNPATNITATTAISGGNISTSNGATINSRGICWSNTTTSPTTNNTSASSGSGIGSFSVSMSSLAPNTTYYVRSFAITPTGTTYGNVIGFKTSPSQLTLSTNPVTNITTSTAISGGNITNSGGSAITSRGICWSNTTSTPTINNSSPNSGSGIGSFSTNMSLLARNTTYYVRAFAINSAGTTYGNVIIFKTLP